LDSRQHRQLHRPHRQRRRLQQRQQRRTKRSCTKARFGGLFFRVPIRGAHEVMMKIALVLLGLAALAGNAVAAELEVHKQLHRKAFTGDANAQEAVSIYLLNGQYTPGRLEHARDEGMKLLYMAATPQGNAARGPCCTGRYVWIDEECSSGGMLGQHDEKRRHRLRWTD
jgi:hypothetical protein